MDVHRPAASDPAPLTAELAHVEDPEPAAPRRASEKKLDIFWLVLAAILVVAVVFVVSVAHNSMNDVGTTAPARPHTGVLATAGRAAQTIVIVQVSSYPTTTAARAAAADLTDRGFSARVLDSDDYAPMNPDYYVVYTGPYQATAAGRKEADRVAARLPDAFVREIHHK